jgi:hypothetical protein
METTKLKIRNLCFKEIQRQIRLFYKYPSLYYFKAKTQAEHENALIHKIKEIIKTYEVVEKKQY